MNEKSFLCFCLHQDVRFVYCIKSSNLRPTSHGSDLLVLINHWINVHPLSIRLPHLRSLSIRGTDIGPERTYRQANDLFNLDYLY